MSLMITFMFQGDVLGFTSVSNQYATTVLYPSPDINNVGKVLTVVNVGGSIGVDWVTPASGNAQSVDSDAKTISMPEIQNGSEPSYEEVIFRFPKDIGYSTSVDWTFHVQFEYSSDQLQDWSVDVELYFNDDRIDRTLPVGGVYTWDHNGTVSADPGNDEYHEIKFSYRVSSAPGDGPYSMLIHEGPSATLTSTTPPNGFVD